MYTGLSIIALLFSQLSPEASEVPPAAEVLASEKEAATAAVAAMQAAQAAQQAAQAAKEAVALMAEQKAQAQAQAKEAEAKAETPASPWRTAANLSLIFLAGNSSSITLNGSVALSYKTEKWIWGGRIYGAYGRARLADADYSSDIAMQGGINLRVDRRFSPMLGAYVLSGIEFDHIKAIESRPFAELGTGVVWIDDKVENAQKTLLTTDLGLRYAHEARFRYYPTGAEIPFLTPDKIPTEPRNLPNVHIVAPRAAITYRYMLTDGISFGEDLEVLLNVMEIKRFWINSATKISVRLSNVFSVSTALTFKYDSEPADNAKRLDTALSLGLDAVF